MEGKFTITFTSADRKSEPSAVAVVRNYETALRKAGATSLQTDPNASWWVNRKVVKDGRQAWAQAEKGNGNIWLLRRGPGLVAPTGLIEYAPSPGGRRFLGELDGVGRSQLHDRRRPELGDARAER